MRAWPRRESLGDLAETMCRAALAIPRRYIGFAIFLPFARREEIRRVGFPFLSDGMTHPLLVEFLFRTMRDWSGLPLATITQVCAVRLRGPGG